MSIQELKASIQNEVELMRVGHSVEAADYIIEFVESGYSLSYVDGEILAEDFDRPAIIDLIHEQLDEDHRAI